MRIGYLVTYFYPYGDGMENNCLSSAKEMVKRGHEVHVFTSDRRDGIISKNKEEIYQGIHIHRSKTFFRYGHYLDFSPGVVLDAFKFDLDILHIHAFGFPLYDFVVVLKKLFSRKTVIVNTPHGPFMALKNYPLWQKIFREIYAFFEYSINGMYDAVVQVNDDQKKWMIKAGVKKKRIAFVPNTIPEDAFRKIENKNFIKKYNLKDKIVICNLGRVMKYKGLDQVIRVMPLIVKKYPNVVLISMGRDKDNFTEYCKNLAKKLKVEKNIRFLGEVDEDDKLRGLDSADIFVLPSEWEAFGIVTLEAMARKTAVVSTDTEGSKYLIKSENGILYKWKDLINLRKGLLALIKNDKLRKKMAKNNYEKSLKFKEEIVAVEYLEKLYYKLLRKKL
ncbi:glycosyltransferase family 4 protein [archaeon]|mgnify:FL=1|jgi:L-malate glycosyltransferase|nr:glycosyltransferase family 4 protein [archaeon]MBT3730673.1 glycosyltransferase family 4 protein [archaeon]MBT4669575.1 glycosyltransferase family 4 protein [archaeon]MBT5030332.1 glycosyltransferase family 4 protein [archaeon]MBT5288375.1 glycosyltransferase family 4 protein [archaeon]